MVYLISKYAITAALVVAISEVAKRSDRLGALLASLPLVTFLTLIWLYFENQPSEKIANHAYYTFWYVLPTLPMFFLFPFFLSRFGFWVTIFFSIVVTIALFAISAIILRRFSIALF